MSANSPQTIGKYQIIREIARSNDIVYEGYDPLMNRRVAVKELNVPAGSSTAQFEDRVKRFQREVKAAGSLAHPGIVTVYEVGEDAGRHFMAMEYLDGRTLRNELDTQGLLPQLKSLELVAEILDALAFAHKNGIVHRDIKPENIQIISTGKVKLTDFGIARLTFEPNLTIDGQVFGTPSYMAPEQVMGKEVDARTDLFSVGSVLIEMMTGQKAFQGDSVVSISYAIMNKEPDIPPSASHAVQVILQNLLQKSPSLRTSSADIALEQVRNVIQDLKAGVFQSGQTSAQSPYHYGTGSYAPMGQMQPPPIQAYPPQIQAMPHQTYGFQPPGPTPPFPQGGFQGHQPIPVMMRPPKTPLFKPETLAGCSRFLAILVSVGLLFGVVGLSVDQFAKAIGKAQQNRGTQSASNQGVSADDRQNAAKFQDEGARYINSNQAEEAIGSYRKAASLDPKQPIYQANLGDAYARVAARESTPLEMKVQNYNFSAEAYLRASELEKDGTQKASYRNDAAIIYSNLADVLLLAGKTSDARQATYKGKALASPGSEVATQLEQTLKKLS